MPTGWTLYKGIYVPTATPTGEAGQILKTNFTTMADQIGVLEAIHSGGVVRSNLAQEDSVSYPIPFNSFRMDNSAAIGSVALGADPGAGLFAIERSIWGMWVASAAGILTNIVGQHATAGATNSYMYAQRSLPSEYVAGTDISIVVTALLVVLAGGTPGGAGTNTIDFMFTASNGDGSCGADLCATAAQNVVTLVSTTHTFTVTGATLNPGDLITLAAHGLATEVGGGGGDDVYVAISDIHLAMSVKG